MRLYASSSQGRRPMTLAILSTTPCQSPRWNAAPAAAWSGSPGATTGGLPSSLRTARADGATANRSKQSSTYKRCMNRLLTPAVSPGVASWQCVQLSVGYSGLKLTVPVTGYQNVLLRQPALRFRGFCLLSRRLLPGEPAGKGLFAGTTGAATRASVQQSCVLI